MRGGGRLPRWAGPAAALLGAAGFGALNVANAAAMAPNWGQDLAFFTQIVHSAASGGPWASPLLFEPQGFFRMVHTHLVLPLVVGAYALFPRHETLLVLHSAFAALALWPALRLGERAGGPAHGLLAVAALVAFAPFQAVATADFRPSVLFVPGLLGAFAAAWDGRTRAALAWGLVALFGRQEASYLLCLAGGALVLLPWGGARRWRTGLALLLLGALTLAAWIALKPEMFFHFDPLGERARLVLDAETRAARRAFALRAARSGMLLGLAAPMPLFAALPVFREMAATWREWFRLVGPSAHYSAFWLPFAAAAAIAGAARLGRRLAGRAWVGGLLLLVLDATAFPPVGPRRGPVELRALAAAVAPSDRVAADYDAIHLLAGRRVLWNVEQLYLPDEERPRSWTGDWPLTLDAVDVVVAPEEHPLAHRARREGWRVAARAGDHVVLRRP